MELSREELKLLHDALWDVWNYVGGEVLDCTGQSEASRDMVIEVVLDADRLEMFCCKNERDEDKKLNIIDTVKKFRKFSYDQQKEIAKARFISEIYY